MKRTGNRALVLQGKFVRLEPLGLRHIDGLVSAAREDDTQYRWSEVPQTQVEALSYVQTAIEWQRAGSAVPFATIRVEDDAVVGSTRFWNCRRWHWPEGHPLWGRAEPDVCEIGYTWLARSAMGTASNTEAKSLMLTYAFETWHVQRVCLHADVRNERSRAAIERIGGKFEGILRAHRIAGDATARDSARYSIIAEEWPTVKQALNGRLSMR